MAYSIKRLENGILLFTIEREERRNAINSEIMEGLNRLLGEAVNPEIKAIAITGTGERAFCSGGDLSEFHALKTEKKAFPMLSKMAGILYSLLTFPKPSLAIMNGTAVGGGCELAAACDFRIAKKNTMAGFIQGRQGIITGWGGGSILAEKFPGPQSMRLLMEAEPKHAEELSAFGFFSSLFDGDPIQAGIEFLSPMLKNEREVLEGYKNIWINKWEHSGLRTRIEKEAALCAKLWEGEAHHRKVSEFLEKKS